MRAYLGMALVAVLLAGCASDGRLINIKSGETGPDEFAILPTRPLTMPTDLAMLPTPTPGGSNITDPTPAADAVAALGGNPDRLQDRGVGAADTALVAYAGRQGTDAGIRPALAQADEQHRSRHGRRFLEIIAGTSVYQRAYRPQRLDSDAEYQRWQRAGAVTSTAPGR
ncbi:MAG: DUF3035 domain-containing protein [Paracoccus sp. (in: a-proteobacteria)]|nr:DUF3035 domain-containing protein [Paracoccus sp. (in: a-proteobacteria)]MDO5648599.1 DUF3035 domain-containing protein [Paracoccus sp. (in: a-proteobacteria)]